MKTVKYVMSLMMLMLVIGCGAMDVPRGGGEPASLILKNSSGYAIQVRWNVLAGEIMKGMPLIVLDNGGEENLGPVDKVQHIAFSSYGEILGHASLGWYQYSITELKELRKLTRPGQDIVLEIKTDWKYKFYVDKPYLRAQPAKGGMNIGLDKGMAFLSWFPRIKNKLLEKYKPAQLESMDFGELIGIIKEQISEKDYLFLSLLPNATRQDINYRFEYLHNKLIDTLNLDHQVAREVERYLRSARDAMLSKAKQ